MSVFISYASEDHTLAAWIRDWMSYEGLPFWMAPDSIPPGKDYPTAIIDALESADVLLLIFTAASNQSQHVAREVERAANRGALIIPFIADSTKPTGAFEYFLSDRQWVTASQPPQEKDLKTLMDAVRERLKEAPDSIQKTADRRKRPKRSPYSRIKPFLYGLGTAVSLFIVGLLIAFGLMGDKDEAIEGEGSVAVWEDWIPDPVEVAEVNEVIVPEAYVLPVEIGDQEDAVTDEETAGLWKRLLEASEQGDVEKAGILSEELRSQIGAAQAYQLRFASLVGEMQQDFDDQLDKGITEIHKRFESRSAQVGAGVKMDASKREIALAIQKATDEIARLRSKKPLLEEQLAEAKKQLGVKGNVDGVMKWLGLSDLTETEKKQAQDRHDQIQKELADIDTQVQTLEQQVTKQRMQLAEGKEAELASIESELSQEIEAFRKKNETKKQVFKESILLFQETLLKRLYLRPMIALGTLYLKVYPDDAEVANRTQDAQELTKRMDILEAEVAQQLPAVESQIAASRLWDARSLLDDAREDLTSVAKNETEKHIILAALEPTSEELETKIRDAVEERNRILLESATDPETARIEFTAFLEQYPDWPTRSLDLEHISLQSQKLVRSQLVGVLEQVNPDVEEVEGWLSRYFPSVPPDWRFRGLPEPGFWDSLFSGVSDYVSAAQQSQEQLIERIQEVKPNVEQEASERLAMLLDFEKRGIKQLQYIQEQVKANKSKAFILFIFAFFGICSGAAVTIWNIRKEKRSDAEFSPNKGGMTSPIATT